MLYEVRNQQNFISVVCQEATVFFRFLKLKVQQCAGMSINLLESCIKISVLAPHPRGGGGAIQLAYGTKKLRHCHGHLCISKLREIL